MRDLVAVLDIGKTNAKVVVADPASGEEVWSRTAPNRPAPDAPYRAIDAAAIEAFLKAALAVAPERGRIGAVVPVAHGGCAALVTADGLALPVMDYEEPSLEEVAAAYRPLRDPFAETGTPFLPLGLNVGRQLYYLETRHPEGFARARRLLFWPQYWAWRLSGVAASEITSLGCHSDLWEPAGSRFSGLARRRGWDRLVPRLAKASDRLGRLAPDWVAATGLDPATEVLAGIHDSNASFFRHRIARADGAPFVVVSSGTWAVLLASGAPTDRLDEARDCQINIDALGSPAPTAKFMGGREYAAIAGEDAAAPAPADLDAVLVAGAAAWPAFAAAGGPFQGHEGAASDAESLTGGGRAALASLYVALVADVCLDLLGAASGDVVLEGPFADSPLIGPVLAALRPGQAVVRSTDRAGTIGGALCLASPLVPPPRLRPVAALDDPRLAAHRRMWRERLGEPVAGATG